MKGKNKRALKLFGQSGQTAVEYILLLAVVASMMVSMLKQVKTYFMGENCTGPRAMVSPLCQVQALWSGQGSSGFRYFNLPRSSQ